MQTTTLGFVYIFEAIGKNAIKVGFSRNPQKRMQGFQFKKPPQRCRMVYVCPGGYRLERKVHRHLATSRVSFSDENAVGLRWRGATTEWYWRTAQVERLLGQLRSGALLPDVVRLTPASGSDIVLGGVYADHWDRKRLVVRVEPEHCWVLALYNPRKSKRIRRQTLANWAKRGLVRIDPLVSQALGLAVDAKVPEGPTK